MPDVPTSALLFAAGCTAWTVNTFAGASGSIVLVALLTYVVRVKTIAPVTTIVSLMASPARIIIWWHCIEWPVVRWYLPGANAGAVLGSFLLTWASVRGLDLIVGMFLLSTPIQYQFGKNPRSFPMKLQWFVPVSLSVGIVSGVVGASSMISMPFYLNYGLTRERMIATGAVHSLFIQIAKIATYGSLGILPAGSVLERHSRRLRCRLSNHRIPALAHPI